MCAVTDSNPRRRHRAAYLAPARRHDFDLNVVLPMDALTNQVPQTLFPPPQPQPHTFLPSNAHNHNHAATPTDHFTINFTDAPSRTPSSDYFNSDSSHSYTQDHHNSSKPSFVLPPILMDMYRALVDLLLLVMVMVMSFFLYDVEITIVKSDEEPITRQTDFRGSRVILRNEYTRSTTNTRTATTTRRGFADSVV